MTHLVAFYREMTCPMDEERALNVVYFCFTETFDTVSCNILIDKLMKHGLDKWAVKGTENWLNCCAQRFAISSMKPSWRPDLYPMILWPTWSNIFINGLHNETEHNFSKFADNTKLGELVDELYGWIAPGGTSPPSQGRQSFFSALWWGTSAVLGSVLGFPLQEGPGHTGMSSGKHQEMSKGLMQVGSERAEGVHPGKEKAQEYLIFMCKIFDGRQ